MIRPARMDELADLSALCLRSKAHWGYDDAFIKACRDELRIDQNHLGAGLVVYEIKSRVQGLAQVVLNGSESELALLYVDPDHIGKGLGNRLFSWAVDFARQGGAQVLHIDADPNAQAFYERAGARLIGKSLSGSIPGRFLPKLEFPLSASQKP